MLLTSRLLKCLYINQVREIQKSNILIFSKNLAGDIVPINTSQSCLSGLEICLAFLEKKGCLLADCTAQGKLLLTLNFKGT